jgi:hypothetical protein
MLKTRAVRPWPTRLFGVGLLSLLPIGLPHCGGYEREPWPEEASAGATARDAGAGGRAAREGGSAAAGSGGTAHGGGRDAGSNSSSGGAAGFGGAALDASAEAGPDATSLDAAAAAAVRINEVNANVARGCDLVELRVVTGGSMHGVELWARTTALLTFGALQVEQDDVIVVHVNASSCAPDFESELLSKTQSTAAGAYATAYDWYATAPGLVSTDLVLTLYDGQGKILDAALFADDTMGSAAAQSEAQAQAVAAAQHWVSVRGDVPATGFVDDAFSVHAAQDLNATGTSAQGESIARLSDRDENSLADWRQGPSTWGRLNVGQSVQ